MIKTEDYAILLGTDTSLGTIELSLMVRRGLYKSIETLVHRVYTLSGGLLLVFKYVIGATFQSCSLRAGSRFSRDAIFFNLPNSP